MYKAGMYKYIKDENRYMLSRASKKKRQEVLQNFKAMMFAMANLKRMTFFSQNLRDLSNRKEKRHIPGSPQKKQRGGEKPASPENCKNCSIFLTSDASRCSSEGAILVGLLNYSLKLH